MKKQFLLICILFLSNILIAQNFDWVWQNPKPQGNTLNCLAATPNGKIFMFGEVGTGYVSFNSGSSWQVVDVDSLYRTVEGAYFVNNNVGYICGDLGMIIKTTDGGNTGFALNSGSIEHLYDIEFYDADTGYVVGASGVILKTTNGGLSWTTKSSPLTANIYCISIVNPACIYLGAASTNTTNYVSKSTDYGNTWVNISPSGFNKSVWDIYFIDANKGWFAAQDGGKVYYTTDGGTTWGSAVTNSVVVPNSLFFTDALTGYVTNNNNGKIHKTTDGGLTYTEYSSGKFAMYGVTALGSTLYSCGKYGSAYKSTNAGLTWSSIENVVTQEALRKIYFYDINNGYAVGGSTTAADSLGIILKTTNGGETWNMFSSGVIKAQVYALSTPSPNAWYAVTGRNTIYKSTDGGVNWFQQTNPISGTGALNDVAFADANTGYVIGNSGGIAKTTNGGTTWTALTSPHGTTAIYSMHMFDAQKIITVGGSAKAYLTTDGGANWTALTVGLPGNYFAVKFLNNNVGYVTSYSSSTGLVAKTTDGGATWTAQTLPINATISIWGIAIKDENIVWLADASGNVFYSQNGGTSWNSAKKKSGNGFFAMSIAGSKLWIAGSGGTILQGFADPSVPVEMTSFSASIINSRVCLNWETATETNNKGFEIERSTSNTTWKSIGYVSGNGTTLNPTKYSFIDENPLADVNYYRLKQIDFTGEYEYSNVIEVNLNTPVKFELLQNYPNPFNPASTISYNVAAKELVSLKVYDVLGNLVQQLVNEVKEPGRYSVEFNSNGKFSSGIYFYELRAGNFVQTRKMILMK